MRAHRAHHHQSTVHCAHCTLYTEHSAQYFSLHYIVSTTNPLHSAHSTTTPVHYVSLYTTQYSAHLHYDSESYYELLIQRGSTVPLSTRVTGDYIGHRRVDSIDWEKKPFKGSRVTVRLIFMKSSGLFTVHHSHN